MTALKRIIPAGMITFLLSMALFSCVEDNLEDIRWDDADHWTPELSIPLGDGSVDVNNYFDRYDLPPGFPGETFPVYYEDSLYSLIEGQIAVRDSFEYSLSDQINSSRYIEWMTVHFRVWNTYPTSGRVQVYFRQGTSTLEPLFEEPKAIDGATPDEEGLVSDPLKHEFKVDLDEEEIDHIYEGDNFLVEASISITREDVDSIRFYEDYDIRMEAAADVKLDVRPSDLGY
jgi:hypothetical protein